MVKYFLMLCVCAASLMASEEMQKYIVSPLTRSFAQKLGLNFVDNKLLVLDNNLARGGDDSFSFRFVEVAPDNKEFARMYNLPDNDDLTYVSFYQCFLPVKIESGNCFGLSNLSICFRLQHIFTFNRQDIVFGATFDSSSDR